MTREGQSFPDIGLLSGICKILEADPCEMLGVPRTEIKLESNNRREQEELLSNLCAEPLQIIFGEDLIPVFAEGIPNGMVAEKRVEVVRKTGILVPEKISYLFIKKVLAEMVREKKNIHNTIGILEGIEEEVLEKGNTNIKEIAKLL